MKKIVVVLAILGSFALLSANESKAGQVLDQYMAAWNEHNIEKIDSFYADDVIWYDLGYDHTTTGKKAVTEAIVNAYLAYVPDMYWGKNGDVFVSGNTIVYEWVYGGTFNGKWGDQTIKNKPFEIKGISTTTVNDSGKIISHKDYYDGYAFQKQLGLIE
jgi:steroid delta-isomerase-like uncharacterized protein